MGKGSYNVSVKRGVFLAIGAVALLIGALLAWNAVRDEREFRRLLASGDQDLGAGDTLSAIDAFSGAVALKNDSMVAYLKRGDGYRRRGEFAAALRDLREAARLDDTAPQPAELLGDVNMAMGRHDRAAEEYRRFVALDDREPRVLYKLALALYQSGDADGAVEPVKRALALDDRLAEGHYLLGVCLAATGQRTAAVRSLLRAVAINPALAPAREALADVYGAMGRSRDRIEQLELLAALDPARVERMTSVALAYADAGRREAALTALTHAADRYPGSPQVLLAQARVWLDAVENDGDRDALRKALEALRPAATRDATSSEALALYGRALLLSGDADNAELALQQAVLRPPIDPHAFTLLISAAEHLGHEAVARDAIRRRAALSAP